MALLTATKDRVVDLTGGQARVYLTVTFDNRGPWTGDVTVPMTATDADILAAARTKFRVDAQATILPGPISLVPVPVDPAVTARNDWLALYRKLQVGLQLKTDMGATTIAALDPAIASARTTLAAGFQASYLEVM
jgi:hypothetical protein